MVYQKDDKTGSSDRGSVSSCPRCIVSGDGIELHYFYMSVCLRCFLELFYQFECVYIF